MITVIRSANLFQGASIQDAVGWALKVTGHLQKKWGMNTQVQSNVGRNPYQIHWLTTYQSLAHLEELTQEIEKDPEYVAMIEESRKASLFDVASVVDTIYRSVP